MQLPKDRDARVVNTCSATKEDGTSRLIVSGTIVRFLFVIPTGPYQGMLRVIHRDNTFLILEEGTLEPA